MNKQPIWVYRSRTVYRVQRKTLCLKSGRRLLLWCDGFIPEAYLLDRVQGRITGVVWMGMGPRHQEAWKFTLVLPFSVSGRADIRWSDLLPASEASGWLVVAPEKKEIEVRLGQ
jgi:hypothetical protein